MDCVREAADRRGPVVNRLGFVSAQGTPVVTYALIAANIAAYLYGSFVLGTNTWIVQWGLWPDGADGYPDFGQDWYRWVTSAFLHFGILHIALNMFVLWQFGTQLEPILGRARFIALYAVSMLGSSAAIMLLGNGSVHGGASGAIFGLIAGFAVILLKLKLPAQSLIASAGIWLAAGFFIGGISWQGHLGGAVAGALVMLAMLRGVERRQQRRNQGITPL
ncbi:rhomboid family intramembrane serine protease [Demequina sp.]|uniref:rhomboid family intramembrane serine protease n=1 Tax=Demequina sp. TaxID=2050685 RepID=UPI003D0FE16D